MCFCTIEGIYVCAYPMYRAINTSHDENDFSERQELNCKSYSTTPHPKYDHTDALNDVGFLRRSPIFLNEQDPERALP